MRHFSPVWSTSGFFDALISFMNLIFGCSFKNPVAHTFGGGFFIAFSFNSESIEETNFKLGPLFEALSKVDELCGFVGGKCVNKILIVLFGIIFSLFLNVKSSFFQIFDSIFDDSSINIDLWDLEL